jgi:replicative DNA helicase
MNFDPERTPPHDIGAEQCVLGGMMLSQDVIAEVSEVLRAQDFYRPAHQVIYDAILDLYGRNEPADPVTVAAELTRANETTRTGGAPYLLKLINVVPVASNATFYAKTVRSCSQQRSLEEAGAKIFQIGGDARLGMTERIDQAWSELEHAVGGTGPDGVAEPVADLLPGYLDDLENTEAQDVVATGWMDLDSLLAGGLRPGQLVIVGARPAVGKSVVLLNIAHHVAIKLGGYALVGSLEMSKKELLDRLVSRQGRVGLRCLRLKNLGPDEWARVTKAVSVLGAESKLLLDDRPGLGIAHLRSQLRAMAHAGKPARVVCVDYLQLMTSGQKSENRQVEVGQLSRALKLLAQEFNVPVVVASQLNRGVEGRADKKPSMSDLRESGSIEQDADIVILLHREDAYDKESPRAGEIDLIVAKHRAGPTATITAAFQGHYCRVADMAHEPDRAPTPLRSVS